MVELDKGSLEPSRIARPQRAVDPLEELAGRIVIAIIDEGVISHFIRIAEKVSWLGVLCREIVLVEDSAAVRVMQEIGFQVIHDPLRHRRVGGSRKEPETAVSKARCRIDQTLRGGSIGDADEIGHIRGPRSGAPERDAAAHGSRGGLIPLSTVIGAAGDDAGAFEDRRERDLKLHCHVAAEGEARYGALRDVDIEGRQGPDGRE